MSRKYKTSEVAKIIGVHPNTVRLYEEIGFITKPRRQKSGHREFTELQISQMRFARLALRGEMLQNGLRKKAIKIIKLCAECNFNDALNETVEYKEMIENESKNAKEAIQAVSNILENQNFECSKTFKRREVVDRLRVSMDTLRNWEMNGLIRIQRRSNGYRVYNEDDLQRLIIIKTLRCANYSLSSILRLMNQLSKDPHIEVETVINTPADDEHIISVCDHLLTSLEKATHDADEMLILLSNLIKKPPL